MEGSRKWLEAGVAVVAAAVILGGAGRTLWLASRPPIHGDAATIPANAATYIDRYASPVEDSRRFARTLTATDNLPGLSVAVALNGEIVWAEGFGWSDVENQTPLTPLTRFRLGALSKPVTAVAAALLHDRGRLDLDAPVQRYVPAYPMKQWPVTTRQLLSDVGGVARVRGDNNDAMPTQHCSSVYEGVRLLVDDPLLFEPGTQHRYAIWNWVLVSAAIEGAAGEPFTDVMVRRVFEPLGMSRTVVADIEGLDDVAHGNGRGPDYSCLAGGGAFLSTPTDLVRLGSVMVKPGFLQRETIAAFQTPPSLPAGASTTYALGWTVKSVELAGASTRVVSHRGSPAGGTVSLLTFPDHALAVAVAANTTDAKGVDPLALRIAEAFARQRKVSQ